MTAPKLVLLLQDPARVAEIPVTEIPVLVGDLERVKALLYARLVTATATNGQSESAPADQLLTIAEAAHRLGVSRDYIYHRTKSLPFVVRLGPRQLRFSARGIEQYIRLRRGR